MMNQWFKRVCQQYSGRVLLKPKFRYEDLDRLVGVYRDNYNKTLMQNKGQYVMVTGPNSPDFLAKIFALWDIGVVPCLIPPKMELKQRESVWAHIRTHTPSNHEALVILTSGTTGTPKGVRLSHDNLISHTEMLRQHIDNSILSNKDTTFSFLPWTHSYGLLGECISVMDRGAKMGLLDTNTQLNFRFPYFFKDFYTTSPSVLFAVPRLLEQMNHHNKKIKTFVRTPEIRRRLLFGKNLRYVISGGAKLDPHVRQDLWEDLNVPILEGYGCTEMSPMVAAQCDFSPSDHSVGNIIAGVNVQIADDNEILVRGANLFMGYVGQKSNDPTSFYATGDTGYISENKLYLNGRKSHIVKLQNGKFVNLCELELMLKHQMDTCQEICVWQKEDGKIVGVAHFHHDDLHQHFFSFNAIGECVQIYRTSTVFTSIHDKTLTQKGEINRQVVKNKFSYLFL